MKTLLLLVLLLLPVTAHATTLDFEVGGANLSLLNTVAAGYGGADWGGNWGLLDQASYQTDYHSTLAFPSGEQVAFNGYGLPVYLEAGSLLVTGAWFAPWTAEDHWYDPYSAHSVTMQGWTDGVLVGSDTLNLDPSAFRYLATDFGPVDQIRILADGGTTARWFLMDNLDLSIAPPSTTGGGGGSAVPEPSTWLLLAGGLVVLGWRVWRDRLWVQP
jgi:hypothetical protein